ncbi:MAG: aminotransferase class I/II-fold pyridoxal phosphate-dependent enzyme [Actinomycetota bacterium]
MGTVSDQLGAIAESLRSFADFSLSLPDDIPCDFLFGNPHEVAGRPYVDGLRRAVEPTGPHHYAYTMNLPAAVEAVAAGLTERFGAPFDPQDVCMTNGNFAGLSVVLRTVCDPGDEVVYVSPPWFFYESLILSVGAAPVRVPATAGTYDLDLDAIAAAIGPRTRGVIVNSPHNPSGRIYPPEQLDGLARVLTEASERNGHPVFLVSDEAYNRIVFDGRVFPTPVTRYPYSFLLYTYAKTLLAPGSRMGYVAIPPTMPEREALRRPMLVAQIATGWAFPISVLQHAIPELEKLAPDIGSLQRRRDTLVGALREQGYDALLPEGTFYVLVRSPLEDDRAFCDLLVKRGVYVLPGAAFEAPGMFRISLTANDEMVERAIPAFAEAIEEARSR